MPIEGWAKDSSGLQCGDYFGNSPKASIYLGLSVSGNFDIFLGECRQARSQPNYLSSTQYVRGLHSALRDVSQFSAKPGGRISVRGLVPCWWLAGHIAKSATAIWHPSNNANYLGLAACVLLGLLMGGVSGWDPSGPWSV